MAKRLPTVLTDEELAALYAQINEDCATGKRNRALLQTMADCGLRLAEALALRREHLVRQNGRIIALAVVQGKGGKDRTAYVTSQLSDKLIIWLADPHCQGERIFCPVRAYPGATLGSRSVQQMVTRLAAEAGIEKRVSPHTFRHTCATRLLRATGGDLEKVRDHLGHANIGTTQVYVHLEDGERQAAVAMLPNVDGAPPAEEDLAGEVVALIRDLPEETLRKLKTLLQ